MLQYSPRIVTDGLVMCLDPSQNKSYPTTDLPIKDGLALWLDAADDTTFSYSSTSLVSQWRDKSGNDFHASQGTVASQPSRSTFQNSRKTVNFDGTNDTVTIPNFRCNSEMSIFVVSNCGSSLLIEHSTDANSNQGFYFYGGGNGMIYITRSTGTLIWNANWLSGGYSIASAVNSTGLDLLTYKNGTQQTITTDNRSAVVNSYVTTTLYIGSRGANSLWSSGPIAEIIIYNRKVTNAERNSIHTYLGQKWGIFNTDRQIFDLSGNNFNFLFNGTNPRYNAKTIVSNFDVTSPFAVSSFGGQNLTSNILNLLYADHTIEVAFNAKGFRSVYSYNNTLTTQDGQSIVIWTGRHSGLRVAQNQILYEYWNSQSSTVGISVNISSYQDKIMYITATRTGDVLRLYINGVLASGPTTVAATTSPVSYSQINIGAANQGNPTTQGYIWAGQHEYHLVRMYNRTLSAEEVSSNYEAFKARFSTNIVRFGLVLDLDAGNPTSYAGAGTTWYDVSGNSYDGTLTGGPVYSTDGGGAFLFSGNYSLSPVSTVNSLNGDNLTVEAWVKHNTFGGAGTGRSYISNWHSFNVSNQRGFILRTYDTQTYPSFWWCWGGANYYSEGPSSYVMQTGKIYHIVATYEKNVAMKIYINGNLEHTTTNYVSNTILFDTSNGLYVGFSNINTSYMDGNIYSARLYNRTLTAAEVLQNYNAAKGRFGL